MKAKTRFLKMFYKLPEKSRLLVWDAYGSKPMTLNVIALEARNDTKLSKEILKDMGYE